MADKELNEQQLQALLRLKRFEQPPPGYFDGLLDSIHRRQREEMLRRPAWRLFLDRAAGFFTSLRRDWAYVGSMAAVLMIGIGAIQIALPRRVPVVKNHPTTPAALVADPAASVALQGPVLSLQGAPQFKIVKIKRDRPREGATGETPVRFVIDAQPASYEQSRIRF